MNIQMLLAQRKAVLDENVTLLAGEALTDEQMATVEANLKKADTLQRQAETLRRQETASAGLDKPFNDRVEVTRDEAEAPFASLGEFLVAVAQASTPGHRVDPRLNLLAAPTGASEGVPSAGGFLVEKDLIGGLLTPTYESAVFASRCRRFPVGANSNGIKIKTVDETTRVAGSRWGGVQVYWLAEAGTKTSSKPKFGKLELELGKVAGLFYATDELLQDATALDGVINECFPTELAFSLDDKIVRGAGGGVPLGILAAPCLVTVAAEAGQGADTLQYENFVNMYARMPGRLRAGAAWFYNQEIEPQLFGMGITLGTGGTPVFLPPGGISGSPYATMFGRPMIPTEQCSALGDLGDVIFANMNEYALIDKGGIQTASSIHVSFTTDETCFRFVYRVDGQPMWKSAVTPAKGANALSPFVTLAAR